MKIILKFRKEKQNKMKLDKHKKLKKHGKSKKPLVAYDTETIYDNSLIPTVSVSFNNITLESKTSNGSTKAVSLPSSRTQTVAPCDICHRKFKRLFSLSQHGLIYFVCHNCCEKRYRRSGEVVSSFVDPSKFTINPQPRVKWEEICTIAEKCAPRLHKAIKANRKNKKV